MYDWRHLQMLWMAYCEQMRRQHLVRSPDSRDKTVPSKSHKFDFAHLAESATRKDEFRNEVAEKTAGLPDGDAVYCRSSPAAHAQPLRVTSFDFRREIGERTLAATLGKTRGRRAR